MILLSHKLTLETPAYNSGPSLKISPMQEIRSGASSNSYVLSFPNHLGTHIDAPKHFDDGGRPIASYDLDELVFNRPMIADLHKDDSELITEQELRQFGQLISKADLLLMRTGFQKYRDTDPHRY
ncbi:MAG: cyclase family protein, partial [Candidatus Bathyarchaeia archaeon]